MLDSVPRPGLLHDDSKSAYLREKTSLRGENCHGFGVFSARLKPCTVINRFTPEIDRTLTYPWILVPFCNPMLKGLVYALKAVIST